MNIDQEIIYNQPTREDERADIAQACVLHMELTMPMLLDSMSNEVDQAYAALPERLYVVDRSGKITYRSEPGPWGFNLDAFEAALRREIERI